MFVVMTSDYVYQSYLLSWLLYHKIHILVNNYVTSKEDTPMSI